MDHPHRTRSTPQHTPRAFWLRMVFLTLGIAYALLEMRFLTRAIGQLWRNRRAR